MKGKRYYETTKFGNIAELEAIVLGMDVAELRTVFTRKETEYKPEERYQAVYNLNRDSLEAVVSSRYKLIQHREAFEPVVQTLKQLGIKLQGKVIYDSGRCYVNITFNDERFKVDVGNKINDVISFGLRFGNSYDATMSFFAETYAMRLVCSNGMIRPVAIKSVRKIHMGNGEFVSSSIVQVIKALETESVKFADIVDRARKEIVTEVMLQELFKAWNIGQRHVEKLLRKANRLDELNQWNIYNLLTEYITHSLKVREQTKEQWHTAYANRVLHTPIPTLIEIHKESD